MDESVVIRWKLSEKVGEELKFKIQIVGDGSHF
jgi:hypothetical protein